MPETKFEEKEGELEAKKILIKKLNKFFSDYFKWLIVLVVAVIFTSGYFFLLAPKYRQTAKYVSVIGRQEALDLEAKKSELAKIKELAEAFKKIDKKYIEKINAIAPVKKNKEELFSEINYLVSQSGLFLQSVSLAEGGDYRDLGLVNPGAGDAATSKKIEMVGISLMVRGADYKAFKNFLANLENNLRIMDVANISFDPSGQAVTLTVNTYYTKE
jgi:Tfp pilus assembly protein PilO